MARRTTIAAASVAALTLALSGCGSSHHAAAPTLPPTASATSPSASSSASSPASSTPASSTATSTSTGAVTSRSLSPTPSSTPPTHPIAVWPTYHHDNSRTGLASSAKPVTALKVVASVKLDGAVYASPLVLSDAHGALVIAATENNTIYALRNSGAIAWSKHIGTAVDGSSLPCGNINPSGITGTPVYDPASGLVFAVAFLSGDKHELVALDATSGAIAWTRPVDPPGSHPNVEQQRAALILAAGKVWVAYGGLFGDCGPYHGYVVGVATNGQGAPVIYQVPSAREAGIWAPSGPAADSAGHLYVSVGNGAQTDPNAPYDMSDSVIELSGANVVSFFAPATWASENAADLDLGTTGPTLLPGGKLFLAGKAGNAYFLTQGNLGGLAGKVPSSKLCTAFGGVAYANGTVYVPCTNGLRAVKVSGGALAPTWRAAVNGSPVIGGGVVLSVSASAGTLFALDPVTGAIKAQAALGDSATRFATPAVGADGHVYVGTQHGRLVVITTS